MTARRMIRTTRRAPNRNTLTGQCGWPEGDGCDHVGPLRPNGLCARHWALLAGRLRESGQRIARTSWGVRRSDVATSERCVCPRPAPVQCRIIGGRIPIPGAFECVICFRQTPDPVLDSDPTPAHGLERPLVMS